MTNAGNGEMELSFKIARLVEERGWNQEDFARISNLNRHTVRQILHATGGRRLRNATVCQCAEALGLTVSELRSQPLDKLLPRMHGKPPANVEAFKLLKEKATHPDFIAWLGRNEERTSEFLPEEIDELLSLQQTGGAMDSLGVEHCIEQIERRRRLIDLVRVLVRSDFIGPLEVVVKLMFEKVSKTRTHSNPERIN